ncbi:hypothetical protein AABB24_031332, partial [Solanum stoloniferum]
GRPHPKRIKDPIIISTPIGHKAQAFLHTTPEKKTEMALKPLSSIFPNSTNPPLTPAKPHHQNIGLSRRDFINVGLSVMPLVISPTPSSIAREVEVGSFLPPSPTDPKFVLFKATPKDTPALRAVSCRKCAALRIYSSSNLETTSYS